MWTQALKLVKWQFWLGNWKGSETDVYVSRASEFELAVLSEQNLQAFPSLTPYHSIILLRKSENGRKMKS